MAEVTRLLRTPFERPQQLFIAALLCLYIGSVTYLLPPFDLAGDAPTYLEAMQVLNGGEVPETFTPNRILTTFLSTATVAALASITGNYLATWFFVNTLYFFGLAFITYLLFRRLTGSTIGGIFGALFLVGNYNVLVFGLNYLMDITGWFWFMLSLLFLSLYIEREKGAYMWGALLSAGVGTLFKEYAFFAFLPIGIYVLYRYWSNPAKIMRLAAMGAVTLIPLLLIHVAVYMVYGYSYLDWYGMNTATFGWNDWAWNAGRSFLVVLSFMLPLAVLGAWKVVRGRYARETKLFVASLALPALAVFLWPIITERLVFLFVPLAALLTAFLVARYERHWLLFGVVWVLYVTLALRTDGLILNTLYAL